MGVYEHPKGSKVWWVDYYVDGKRHREKVGRKSDATDLYRVRKAAGRLGQKLPELRKKKVLLAEVIQDAVDYAKTRHKSARDYVTKGAISAAALGGVKVDDLTPQMIETFLESRSISGATFNRYKAFFSLALRLAIRNGKAEVNVARSVERKRESSGRQRFLSREEFSAVLPYLDERQKAAVEIAAFTGMRLGEQFGLDWSCVDWKRREVLLKDSKNGTERSVPLNSIALAAFEAMRSPNTSGLVFRRRFSGTKAVQPRWFKAALKEAKIRDVTWHTLRHTFCSWHAMAGTPLKTIQELAGHKTISITGKYAHLSPDHTSREAERIVATPKVVEMKRKKA